MSTTVEESATTVPSIGSSLNQGTSPPTVSPTPRISQLPANPWESMVLNVLSGGRTAGSGGSAFHQPSQERTWDAVVSIDAGHCAGSTADSIQRFIAAIKTSPGPVTSNG